MAVYCCGFGGYRWCLIILNVFYIAVGIILVGLVVVAQTFSYFTEVGILIGIALCATGLVLVASLGLVATAKHHQVMMFFYMLLLGVSTVTMFAITVAAIAIPRSFQSSLFYNTWTRLDKAQKASVQDALNCCGFNSSTANVTYDCDSKQGHPQCNSAILTQPGKCCSESALLPVPCNNQSLTYVYCPRCVPCYSGWETTLAKGVQLAGGFGFVFGLTQIIGILMTLRYRNMRDPDANPSAFL
ncbi:hypothetical protein EMCRGX_G006077 [Ephydatia muelleri]